MTVALACFSHTPLMQFAESTTPDAVAEVEAAFGRLKAWIADYDPELIVQFGPDHLSGFYYDIIPSFCIGARAESIGDYDLPPGPLKTDERLARDLARHVLDRDIDAAISFKMKIDHGFTQGLERLFGGIDRIPIVPIYVNCLIPPRPSFRRTRALGEAVGSFLSGVKGRVLILATGGLSHDPPFPDFDAAPAELQRRMIEGFDWNPVTLKERTQRLLTVAREFATGEHKLTPINEPWDRAFMAALHRGETDVADSWNDGDVVRVAGGGGGEVRTWIAAFAALRAAGGAYVSEIDYSRKIDEWIIGFGMMRAWPVSQGPIAADSKAARAL